MDKQVLESAIKELQQWCDQCHAVIAGLQDFIGRSSKGEQAEHSTCNQKGQTEAKSSKPKQVQYLVSHKRIIAVLENSGGPLSTFAIRQALEDDYNVKVTEKMLKDKLKAGLGMYYESPEQDLWINKTD